MAWFNRGKLVIFDATLENEAPVDLTGDVIKVALMDTAYTPDIDSHTHFDDISANEITATNYTTRGSALASKAIALDTGNDRAEFDAADLTFTSLGNGTNDTFDTLVFLREPDSTPSNANSVLLWYIDVASTTTNGSNVTFQWSAEGIAQAG